MKRMLLLLATVSAVGMADGAVAQDRSLRNADRPLPSVERVIPRASVDTNVIVDRLRGRGVPESNIGITIERIRAALQSGEHPHLLRRLYNAGLIGDDQDPNRRRFLNAGDPDDVTDRRRFFDANDGDDAATDRRRLRTDRPSRDGTDRRVRDGDDLLRDIIVLEPARTDRTDRTVRVGRGG
jgi:hypothetical protein